MMSSAHRRSASARPSVFCLIFHAVPTILMQAYAALLDCRHPWSGELAGGAES